MNTYDAFYTLLENWGVIEHIYQIGGAVVTILAFSAIWIIRVKTTFDIFEFLKKIAKKKIQPTEIIVPDTTCTQCSYCAECTTQPKIEINITGPVLVVTDNDQIQQIPCEVKTEHIQKDQVENSSLTL